MIPKRIINTVGRCVDCHVEIIRISSSHIRCEGCRKNRLRLQRALSAKARYHRIKNGGIANTIGIEIVCRCGRSYTKINPMVMRCLECQKAHVDEARNRYGQRQNALRRAENSEKWDNVSRKCRCGRDFKVDMRRDCQLYCAECSDVMKKIYEIAFHIRHLDKIVIRWQDIYDMYIKQERRCNITNMKMTNVGLKAISADRIDNSKPHNLDNIQLVCKWVNLARNNHTIQEIKLVLDEFKSM